MKRAVRYYVYRTALYVWVNPSVCFAGELSRRAFGVRAMSAR